MICRCLIVRSAAVLCHYRCGCCVTLTPVDFTHLTLVYTLLVCSRLPLHIYVPHHVVTRTVGGNIHTILRSLILFTLLLLFCCSTDYVHGILYPHFVIYCCSVQMHFLHCCCDSRYEIGTFGGNLTILLTIRCSVNTLLLIPLRAVIVPSVVVVERWWTMGWWSLEWLGLLWYLTGRTLMLRRLFWVVRTDTVIFYMMLFHLLPSSVTRCYVVTCCYEPCCSFVFCCCSTVVYSLLDWFWWNHWTHSLHLPFDWWYIGRVRCSVPVACNFVTCMTTIVRGDGTLGLLFGIPLFWPCCYSPRCSTFEFTFVILTCYSFITTYSMQYLHYWLMLTVFKYSERR